MFKSRTPILIVAAIIVVAAVATAIYLRVTTTQAVAPAPAVVEEDVAVQAPAPAAPVAGAPSVPYSAYVSEEALKRDIQDAAEQHWDTRGASLLDVLNGRYQRRVNHLPW